MKRFGKVFIALPMVLILTSCGQLYGLLQSRNEAEASNTKASLEVTIKTAEKEETITPSMDKNNPSEVKIAKQDADLLFESEGSKIAAITQQGYFYEDGFLIRREVQLGFTKLPDYSYTYTIHIPQDESFPVEVELNNEAIYYLVLSRE